MTFDQAITGCMLVYSVLEDEVQKLYARADSVSGRIRYLWREEAMKDLLHQIRGQQTALTLLIQALQMYVFLPQASARSCSKSEGAANSLVSVGIWQNED